MTATQAKLNSNATSETVEISQNATTDAPHSRSILISSVTSMAVPSSRNLQNSNVATRNPSFVRSPNLQLREEVTTASHSLAKTSISNSRTTSADPASKNTDNDDSDVTLVDYQPGRNIESHRCNFCDKYFPADIIVHHKTLHFREKFFCCVACGKNFRTEPGLETHRCDETL